MFEFGLMHVNRNISPTEVLESTGMIKMQMSHDNSPDVFDRVTSTDDGCGEFSDN